ncbi:hypothetical protein [Cellulomonas massiliensis]|uniref:hypothetical protein n=1 Tax=Cellulomonas massiliensis TaxID=1465811 RepID=UPI0003085812|nr:hypothetical protein [Cellulomonas massiliensis]
MPARPDDHDDAADQPVPPEGSDAPGGDDEDTWASLVARLEQVDSGDDDGRAGREERGATPDGPRVGSFPVAPWVEQRVVRPAGPADGGPGRELDGRDWDGTSQYDEAETSVDEQEHFVPPDPGPVLGGDPLLTMAWLAVAGMPVFLLVVLIAWRGAPSALVQAACVVFLLGVAVLVWRMPTHRDPSDDDTGAQV